MTVSRLYFYYLRRIRFPSGVIVQGDPRKICLGKDCYIEPGTVFNVQCGGTISIGSDCQIYRGAILAPYGGNIDIGNFCSVNPYTIIYGHGGVKIGDYVRIAAQVVIVPANHVFSERSVPIHQQGLTKQGITIEDDVWIGTGAKILDGVTIERGAIVAAGAIVNKSLPAYTICGGIPCKVLKER